MLDRIRFATLFLLLSATAAPAIAQVAGNVPEAPEPNSSPLTSSVLQCGRQGIGDTFIGPAGDPLDLWSFTVPERSEVVILISARDGDECFAFDLRDANNTVLVGYDDDLFGGCQSQLRIVLDPGFYYVGVVGGFRSFGALLTQQGRYALDIACLPVSPDASCQALTPIQEMEPNNNAATAQPVPLCSSTTGDVFDIDVFRIDLPSRQELTLTFELTSPPFNLIEANLLGADGTTLVAAMPQRVDTFDLRVREIFEPGTYYAAITQVPLGPRSYVFRVEARPFQSGDVVAGQVVSGVACGGSLGPSGFEAVTMSGEIPLIGSTYSLRFEGPTGVSGDAFALLSPRPIFDPGLDLAVIGSPGCELYVQPDVVIPLGGQGFVPATLALEWFLPADLALVGASLSTQALVRRATSGSPEILTSNVITATIGNWAP